MLARYQDFSHRRFFHLIVGLSLILKCLIREYVCGGHKALVSSGRNGRVSSVGWISQAWYTLPADISHPAQVAPLLAGI